MVKVFAKSQKFQYEAATGCVLYLIKLRAWGLQLYQKGDSGTCVFLWILRNFWEDRLYRTFPNDCICRNMTNMKSYIDNISFWEKHRNKTLPKLIFTKNKLLNLNLLAVLAVFDRILYSYIDSVKCVFPDRQLN